MTLYQIQNDPKIRTQVVLTASIKRMIQAKKKLNGETLSEYLRKAALLRLMSEDQEKVELERLANSLIGSLSLSRHPEWKTKTKLLKWQKKLRESWE